VTKRDVGSVAIAVVLGGLVALIPPMSFAQSNQAPPDKSKTDNGGKFGSVGPGGGGQKGGSKGKAAPSGPTPHMPDGKVDLQGVWNPANFSNSGAPFDLQPWAAALLKERRDNLSKDDPEGFCLPAGVPRISPFPQKTIQTPAVLVILEEGNVHSYRQIFLDGRGHSKQDQLWMGDSIGKWDGDTLVVDTVGFNDKTWLTGQGVPHTDQLHVVERFSRPDLGHLQIDITVEDPGAFTKPHSFQRIYNLMENTDLLEYVCNEFNVDKDHLYGK
jgi:hypothetical protein